MNLGNDLGAKLFGRKTIDTDHNEIDNLPSSGRFIDFLLAIGGAVIFDNGARYKPSEASPWTRANGYANLEMLYGLGDGEHTIKGALVKYASQLPPSCIPVGEAAGGNLICVDRTGAVHFWDHENGDKKQTWRIAPSLDIFLEMLEPDAIGGDNSGGIIKSESFLDF